MKPFIIPAFLEDRYAECAETVADARALVESAKEPLQRLRAELLVIAAETKLRDVAAEIGHGFMHYLHPKAE